MKAVLGSDDDCIAPSVVHSRKNTPVHVGDN